MNGAQVIFGGAALTTTYVSPTRLTANGTENTAGMYAVSVSNPNPGSSASASINVTVTSVLGRESPAERLQRNQSWAGRQPQRLPSLPGG